MQKGNEKNNNKKVNKIVVFVFKMRCIEDYVFLEVFVIFQDNLSCMIGQYVG